MRHGASRAALFQSTLLMRGATGLAGAIGGDKIDFNPRSSCEERQDAFGLLNSRLDFNPRSSCEERRDSVSILSTSL